MNFIVQRSRLLIGKSIFRFASEIEKPKDRGVARRDNLQFSKTRLTEFGELPFGEIPEALKVSRPTGYRSLENGVKVVSESWNSPITSITVLVRAGSRHETLENSSVATFVSRLITKGSTNKSKQQIDKDLDLFGGSLTTRVSRETTTYTLTFNKDQLTDAVNFLSELLSNSTFNETQVEAEKATLYREAISLDDPFAITSNNIHYTSFRDHYLGQPVNGIRENIHNITAEQVHNFHKQFYVGSNITVSASGNVDFNKLSDAVSNSFGKLLSNSPGEVPNSSQPFFTPSLMFQRDDQIANISAAVAFVAPGITHPDWLGMKFLKRVIGQYRVDRDAGAHLNSPELQYNLFHAKLAEYPDIVAHKAFYYSYGDVGLFGNFCFGNEVFHYQYLFLTQALMTDYASRIGPEEVFRARARFFNDLLNRNSSAQSSRKNAIEASYLNRVLTRTEVAQKITNMDPAYINRLVTKWFWDKDIAVTAWGPLHHTMSLAHYNRPYRRSTLGDYGMTWATVV